MNGIINLYKPLGISSAKAISTVKHAVYPDKCGHMGTLDPEADGVLLVGVGKAVRLFDYMLAKHKIYEAEFTFGMQTDTLDRAGKVVRTLPVNFTEKQLVSALNRFTGKLEQLPPNYSAKNIGGRRAYELAREGAEFQLQPKEVEVYAFDFMQKAAANVYRFRIECGGGTFIRSLARDLGEALETCCYMSALTRTACGGFHIADSISAERIDLAVRQGKICQVENDIVPVREVLKDVETVTVEDSGYEKLANGVPVVPRNAPKASVFTVCCKGELFGLGKLVSDRVKVNVWLKD